MSIDAQGDPHSRFEDFLSDRRGPDPADHARIAPPPSADEVAHQRLVGNLRRLLARQLGTRAGTVLPAGTAVLGRSHAGDFFYTPDLVVDARPWDGNAVVAPEPVVVFETAIPGSVRADFVGKWQIFRAAHTVGVHVFVDQVETAVTVRRRQGDHWAEETHTGEADHIVMPTIHVALLLADLYADPLSSGEDGPAASGNTTLS